MNLKKLAVANGVVGLVGGIILLFGIWIVSAGAIAGAVGSSTDGYTGASMFMSAIKIAILVLGIIGLLQFNKKPIITKSPSVLLIVGGAISLIPFFGWIGGIISIVGGSMYLAGLKNFKE